MSVVVGIGLSGGLASEIPAPSAAQAPAITLVLPDGSRMPLPVLHAGSPTHAAAALRPRAAAAAPPPPAARASPTAPSAAVGTTPDGRAPLSILDMPAARPAATVAPPPIAASTAQPLTGQKTEPVAAAHGSLFGAPVSKPPESSRAAIGQSTAPLRAPNGLPTAADPTLSIGLPAPVPVGVANFFVDHFDVPPFLLPIFEAAGARYQVPWQVLAAINQIETDYGRNLSVSSAGATGWMQILPQTWRAYGVDATGSGVKDPYNPADAIFAAARLLHAAGASSNLRQAIFAYDHASWYVESVMLRASLIGGLPPELVGSITGLADGVFPVHADVRYADDVAEAAALRSASAKQSAKPSVIKIFAAPASSVVAVKAGLITAIGSSAKRGRYVHLRDAYGNTYVYSQLGHLATEYAAAKPPAVDQSFRLSILMAADALLTSHDPPPEAPATAGHQAAAPSSPLLQSPAPIGPAVPVATDTSAGPRRLFAHPTLPASFAAGGQAQLAGAAQLAGGPSGILGYTTNPDGLPADSFVLAPLVAGVHVLAGTVLGQIGPPTATDASHISFQVRPPGRNTPYVDPKPILDGWQLLQATANRPALGVPALFGPGRAASLDEIGWETTAQLEAQVLDDPAIAASPRVRQAVQAGSLDQPALAALEFLAASGLTPTVSAVHAVADPTTNPPGNPAPIAAPAPVIALDISAINGVPVAGHQGAGSITDIAIRQLLSLPVGLRPLEVNNQLAYSPGETAPPAGTGQSDQIALAFAPASIGSPVFGRVADVGLTPPQWLDLVNHLNRLNNPTVATQQSSAAIADPRSP